MPQTSIAIDPDVAFEGMDAYPMLPRVVMTHYVSQVGGIPFGRALVRAGENTVKLPTTANELTNTFKGISWRREYSEANSEGYSNLASLPVLRRGYLWVLTEGPVTEESPVYARFAASGGNTILGLFRADADSASAGLVPGAKFMASLAAAGLTIVEVK
jgi:hypothetical protein